MNKIFENWGNGRVDISDMAIILMFLATLSSFFSGSMSFKKKSKRKKV